MTDMTETYLFPNEPQYFTREHFERLMIHVHKSGGSDVTIQSEEPVKLHVNGGIYNITRRKINYYELTEIVNDFYGSNGTARVLDGNEIDGSMVIRCGQTNLRFRVNVTGCYVAGCANGMQLTARVINSKPMSLEQMSVEQEIIDGFYPDDGLVLVCGSTGSGKSSLLAGAMAHRLSDPNVQIKLITAESPIEYVYDEIEKHSSSVAQSEVPTNLKSFAAAVRNALRRAPDYILIGEARDRETIEATLEASETGHTVYSTVHSDSVHGTLYRLINAFLPDERPAKMYEIIEQLRMIVVQRLLKKKNGGRVACREFLVISNDIRDQLRSCDYPRQAVAKIKEITALRGRSMSASAKMLLDKGLIDFEEYNRVTALDRASRIEREFHE